MQKNSKTKVMPSFLSFSLQFVFTAVYFAFEKQNLEITNYNFVVKNIMNLKTEKGRGGAT